MKKSIKILTILTIILAILIAIIPVSVFATDTYTLTINGTVNNRKFEVYKIFDATATGTANQYSYAFTTEARNYFVAGNVTNQITLAGAVEYLANLENDANELYSFASEYVASTVTSPVKSNQQGTDASGVQITGLTSGYYLVHETTTTPTPTSSNILVQVVGNKTINLKAVTETLTKTTTTKTASVGDVIPYTITSVMPSTSYLQYDGSPNFTFTFTDTMSAGLDYIDGSVVVNVDDVASSLTAGTDYTVENNYTTTTNQSANETETLVITLGAYAKLHPELAGKAITITYNARVNSNAVLTSNITNTIKYERSTEGTTSLHEVEIPVSPEVYVFNAQFTKKSALGTTLNGATFQLYYSADGTTYDTTPLYVTQLGTKYIINTNATSGNQTITGGTFEIQGLKAGYYKLVETAAPTNSGYDNKNFDGTNNNAYIFQITYNAGTATMINRMTGDIASYLSIDTPSITAAFANKKLAASLLNSKATILPSTGGIGTTIFTVVGILVMVSAAGVLVYRNKKNNVNQ